jgi:hypothetical protein
MSDNGCAAAADILGHAKAGLSELVIAGLAP